MTRPIRMAGRACSALVATGAMALVVVPAALAHATLVSSTPSDGAVLVRAPKQVVLAFNEPVESGLGSVRVYDGGLDRVDDGVTTKPEPTRSPSGSVRGFRAAPTRSRGGSSRRTRIRCTARSSSPSASRVRETPESSSRCWPGRRDRRRRPRVRRDPVPEPRADPALCRRRDRPRLGARAEPARWAARSGPCCPWPGSLLAVVSVAGIGLEGAQAAGSASAGSPAVALRRRGRYAVRQGLARSSRAGAGVRPRRGPRAAAERQRRGFAWYAVALGARWLSRQRSRAMRVSKARSGSSATGCTSSRPASGSAGSRSSSSHSSSRAVIAGSSPVESCRGSRRSP